ncbi:hypothetical protein QR680_016311 [Steinernema hermaphroditum]|uniref:Ground-like domain-containing protein n=1 Tax=Steinernema hermaphroditum TaxID=289476 RepID=A0AA39LMF3_9BILA|nr:hypothetical protein QR680_016311 [Steinernema hermaphroditum]
MNGYLQVILFVAIIAISESCFAPPAPPPPAPSCCCPPPPPPSCGCGGRKKREANPGGERLCPEARVKALIKKSLKADPAKSKLAVQQVLKNAGYVNAVVNCDTKNAFEKAPAGPAPSCVYGNEKTVCKVILPDNGGRQPMHNKCY